MSIQAVAWVLEHSQAKLTDRLVLIAIANHADARGWNAWPSIPKIAEEAGVHETTVWRSIKALEVLGELTVQRRPGKNSRYGLTALAPLQPAMGDPLQTAKGRPLANRKAPLANRKKPLAPVQYEPSVTVNEPSCAGARASTHTPELPADMRARGAEFFKALRKGAAE